MRRALLACGMLAPLIFVGVFLIEGWLRPDYSARSMFVSELSLGPRGWIQITSFLVTGSLVAAFAWGVRGRGSRLVAIIGVALAASGVFSMDPAALGQHSAHAIMHGIFGAIVFSLAPITCFVMMRRFRPTPSVVAGSIIVVAVLLMRIGIPHWNGAIQRVALITFFAWLFAFAAYETTRK